MESKHFSLEVYRNNRFIRIFQIVFGIICAVLAVVWLILNLNSLKTNSSLLLSIIFLFGFAYYQINSGLGRSEKYIEISHSSIRLKKNSLLPVRELKVAGIEKIEIFPLSIVFFLRSGNKNILRFGTTFTEVIEPVKEEIKDFCSLNNLKLEVRREEL